jgi:cytochrome c553
MLPARNKLRFASLTVLAAMSLVVPTGSQTTLAQSASTVQSSASKADARPLTASKLAETLCSACHGQDGNSIDPQYPKLAGQNPDYIRVQLRAFKSGARRSDVMSGIALTLSEPQVFALAHYFSNQPVKPDVVKDPQLAAIGARIFRYAAAGMPPCVACHGNGGSGSGFGHGGMMGGGMMGGHMGMMMGGIGVVPNLYGQHAAYIVRQLDAFADGERRGSIMNDVAPVWRAQDRLAVAEYLSGLR